LRLSIAVDRLKLTTGLKGMLVDERDRRYVEHWHLHSRPRSDRCAGAAD
jgi:hypothetical protein